MSWLAAAWFVARKDVQYLLLKRETILWVFVMPIVFFYFIGTITGGFRSSGEAQERIAVRAPADAGFLVDAVIARLEGLDYQVVRPATEEEFQAHRRRVTFPSAFTDSVLAGRSAGVLLEREGEGPALQYDEVRVQRALYTVVADLVVTSEAGEAVNAEALERLRQTPRSVRLEVAMAGERRRIPTGFEQAIPGTMTMFTLLVLVTSGAVFLVAERREGLLRRIAATPLPLGAVVLGKWGGRMALGLVQIAFAMVAGTVLFRMDWGASVAMIAVVLLVYAALNASLGLLMGNIARTEGQAVGVGVLSANVLAALGGCWWPIEVTPRWMQTFSLFLPTGWAMDAMHKLVSFGAGWTSTIPHVVAMAVGAWVAGWVAVKIFRFQ